MNMEMVSITADKPIFSMMGIMSLLKINITNGCLAA